jgi:hypothetical protein
LVFVYMKITATMATIATTAATHQPATPLLRRTITRSGSRVTVVRSYSSDIETSSTRLGRTPSQTPACPAGS